MAVSSSPMPMSDNCVLPTFEHSFSVGRTAVLERGPLPPQDHKSGRDCRPISDYVGCHTASSGGYWRHFYSGSEATAQCELFLTVPNRNILTYLLICIIKNYLDNHTEHTDDSRNLEYDAWFEYWAQTSTEAKISNKHNLVFESALIRIWMSAELLPKCSGFILLLASVILPSTVTRGQSNLTKSASRGAHSPVRGVESCTIEFLG